MNQEGVFQDTRFRVAIPYNYRQPSSSTGAMLSKLLRSLFQWSDDEEEANVYASFVTVSSEQTGFVSVNIADNNHDNDFHQRMEAQEQTSKAQ